MVGLLDVFEFLFQLVDLGLQVVLGHLGGRLLLEVLLGRDLVLVRGFLGFALSACATVPAAPDAPRLSPGRLSVNKSTTP